MEKKGNDPHYAKIEIIKKMKKLKVDTEVIAEFVEVPKDEVYKIKE